MVKKKNDPVPPQKAPPAPTRKKEPASPPTPSTDRDHANKSGIPLQRWIAQRIRWHDWTNTTFTYHWKVEGEEVPVGGAFLDLLVRGASHPGSSHQAPVMYAAIEVKRAVDSSGKPSRFLFLNPPDKGRWPTLRHALLPYLDPAFMIDTGGGRLEWPHPQRLCAGEFSIGVGRQQPRIAEHCIFTERKGSDTLDDTARDLMNAINALSLASIATPGPFAFLPIIVTNAELRVLQLEDVDLDTGTLTKGQVNGDDVPWVAYTKTLAQEPQNPFVTDTSKSYAEWSDERIRTVFVVRASRVIEFLATLQMSPPDDWVERWSRRGS